MQAVAAAFALWTIVLASGAGGVGSARAEPPSGTADRNAQDETVTKEERRAHLLEFLRTKFAGSVLVARCRYNRSVLTMVIQPHKGWASLFWTQGDHLVNGAEVKFREDGPSLEEYGPGMRDAVRHLYEHTFSLVEARRLPDLMKNVPVRTCHAPRD
jgi:hypothetical protein